MIIKATEGQGFVSGAYAPYRAKAEADGSLVGSYHFAWPNQDPAKEAANYLATAQPRAGELVSLDVENWGTGAKPTPEMLATSWAQRLAFTLAWLRIVGEATGCKPFVYANWDWIKGFRGAATAAQWAELTAHPLWLAEPGTPGQHSIVKSQDGTDQDCWPILIHQYTADRNGAEPGRMDGDYTPDLDALRRLAKP